MVFVKYALICAHCYKIQIHVTSAEFLRINLYFENQVETVDQLILIVFFVFIVIVVSVEEIENGCPYFHSLMEIGEGVWENLKVDLNHINTTLSNSPKLPLLFPSNYENMTYISRFGKLCISKFCIFLQNFASVNHISKFCIQSQSRARIAWGGHVFNNFFTSNKTPENFGFLITESPTNRDYREEN